MCWFTTLKNIFFIISVLFFLTVRRGSVYYNAAVLQQTTKEDENIFKKKKKPTPFLIFPASPRVFTYLPSRAYIFLSDEPLYASLTPETNNDAFVESTSLWAHPMITISVRDCWLRRVRNRFSTCPRNPENRQEGAGGGV